MIHQKPVHPGKTIHYFFHIIFRSQVFIFDFRRVFRRVGFDSLVIISYCVCVDILPFEYFNEILLSRYGAHPCNIKKLVLYSV